MNMPLSLITRVLFVGSGHRPNISKPKNLSVLLGAPSTIAGAPSISLEWAKMPFV